MGQTPISPSHRPASPSHAPHPLQLHLCLRKAADIIKKLFPLHSSLVEGSCPKIWSVHFLAHAACPYCIPSAVCLCPPSLFSSFLCLSYQTVYLISTPRLIVILYSLKIGMILVTAPDSQFHPQLHFRWIQTFCNLSSLLSPN